MGARRLADARGSCEARRCLDEAMRSRLWGTVTLSCLLGCVGPQRQFRQTLGPGPGPGCASTLDCECKSGSAAACEQLATVAKPPKTPNAPAPVPVLPPGALKSSGTDKGTKEQCVDHYAKCVELGGEHLPGRIKNETRCGSCLEYCTSHGFWPEALYSWNGVRLPCPGL